MPKLIIIVLFKKCITFELYYLLYITIVLFIVSDREYINRWKKMQSFFVFGGGGTIIKFKSKHFCVGLCGLIDKAVFF
jgi:hypothetical protein